MPSREPISLGPAAQTATSRRRSQCWGGKTCLALSPSHTAHPPGTLRAAEPLPRRASAESSSGDLFCPAAAQAATASAANPLALEASPAAVGKKLREKTRALSRIRAASSKARTLEGSCGAPSSSNESSGAPSSTLVSVRSRSSATLSEPASGTISASSRFPQYFTSAMFACATADVGESDAEKSRAAHLPDRAAFDERDHAAARAGRRIDAGRSAVEDALDAHGQGRRLVVAAARLEGASEGDAERSRGSEAA